MYNWAVVFTFVETLTSCTGRKCTRRAHWICNSNYFHLSVPGSCVSFCRFVSPHIVLLQGFALQRFPRFPPNPAVSSRCASCHESKDYRRILNVTAYKSWISKQYIIISVYICRYTLYYKYYVQRIIL